MAKLLPSLGALCFLGRGAAAAAGPVRLSPSPTSPSAAVEHMHHLLVRQALRDVPRRSEPRHTPSANGKQPRRRTQLVFGDENVDGTCPGTPLLWKIVDDATGDHVGFGLGTMHLPVDVVTTDGAYGSIVAAIEDSCDVYGELNLHDPSVNNELASCVGNATLDAATVADLPADLQSAIASKMDEVGALISPDDAELAELIASRLLTLPLGDVQRVILFANTPEYAEGYLETIYSGVMTTPLDAHLLSLGRPAEGLEEVETQCDLIEQLNPSAEEVNANIEAYRLAFLTSLDASLSKEIALYRCGDIDKFLEGVTAGIPTDEFTNDLLFNDRNNQMAQKMDEILKANPNERIMFAVGSLHWVYGDSSLENLMKGYGYTLEHVPEWHSEMAENHSNTHCKVLANPVTGLFDEAPEGFTHPPSTTPEDFPNVGGPMYFTNSSAVDNATIGLELVDATGSPTASPPAMTTNPTSEPTAPSPSGPSQPSSGILVGASKSMILLGGLAYSIIVL